MCPKKENTPTAEKEGQITCNTCLTRLEDDAAQRKHLTETGHRIYTKAPAQ